mgnify:CR=1 FL=1|jgi:hypothetical protein
MVWAWFDAKEAKAFGADLAAFYLARVKTEADAKSSKFVEKKQRILLDKLTQRIVAFRRSHKLNIYKKAQIGNVFKWHLLEAGFDTAYVDELTSWVTHNL